MYRGLRDEIRSSQSRRRYLETVACIVSGQDLSVKLDENKESAHINMEDMEVVVTSKEHEQPATNLPPNVYDLIRQEGHLLHEVAHALWTDSEAFQQKLSEKDGQEKQLFGQFWNILEDGAIERQLSKEFNVETELKVKNANMCYDDQEQAPDSFCGLLFGATFDLAKYDSGSLRKILDGDVKLPNNYDDQAEANPLQTLKEFVSEARPLIAGIKSESDSAKRTEKIDDFFKSQIIPRIDWDNSDGTDSDAGDHEHGEGSQMGEGQKADGLEGEEDEVEQEMEKVLSGEAGEEEGEDDEDGGEGGMAAGKEEVDLDEDEIDGFEEEVKSQIQNEGFDESQAEKQFASLQQTKEESATRRELRILTEPGDSDKGARERYNEAKRIGRRIGRDLETRLQRERRAKEETMQSEGSFDSRRMVAAARGDQKVFKRLRQGDEKDYDFVVVFDRSGSMSRDIHGNSPNAFGSNPSTYEEDEQLAYHSEIALGAMLEGLEQVGAKTQVIDMYRNGSWVSKYWHESFDQASDKIFRGQSDGRTPLDACLEHAIEEGKKRTNPVILVISDGEPDDKHAYREQLESATMPVLGLYLRPNHSKSLDDETWFHRQETCNDPDEMLNSLQRLIRGIML